MKKIAVVTGGAGGIGRAVAERFARDAYELVLIDLNTQAGAEVAAEWHRHGSELVFHQADLTQENAVKKTFEKIIDTNGRIDALINVAGGSLHRHPLAEFPLAHWEAVIAANLTSTFLCCRAAIEPMQKQKNGAIVNISSDIAFGGDAGRSAYAAAKAGILGLTRSLALELATTGVRANAVAPGRIATPRIRANYTDAEWEAAAKRIPMGHAGEAETSRRRFIFLQATPPNI